MVRALGLSSSWQETAQAERVSAALTAQPLPHSIMGARYSANLILFPA